SEDPLSLYEASGGIAFPEQIELVVKRLLEKSPQDRFANAVDVRASLLRVQHLDSRESQHGASSKSEPNHPDLRIADSRIVEGSIDARQRLNRNYGSSMTEDSRQHKTIFWNADLEGKRTNHVPVGAESGAALRSLTSGSVKPLRVGAWALA